MSLFLPFTKDGYLYPGIYYLSWADFLSRFGTNYQRRTLLEGLYSALTLLAQAGCKEVYIGGSFVTV
ncbi:DUF6932 family protein [Merismopedia glauca]|uniref:DUF6932 family protein n=1 Tax=Merismopedia glauca TaxID=292586 RepID=UPI0026A928D3